MKHWDLEIAKIGERLPDIFRNKPDAAVGVAVDDAKKRDYFVPRLQRLMNERQFPGTLCVIPVNNDPAVDVRAQPCN